MMGGQAMGMMGGPGMGMMGGQAMGMMGGPGMGMMGMGMGMMGGFNGATQEAEAPPFYVMTVVETADSLNKKQLDALNGGKPIKIKTKWGTSILQPEPGLTIKVITNNKDKPIHSVMRQFDDRLKEAQKDGAATPDLLLDYNTNPQAGPARFALEHGLLKEYRDVMLRVKELDPNNPKVKALQKIEAAMAQPITKPDFSGLWKQRLGLRDSRQSEHYVLLYSPGAKDDEIQSRLKSLEDSYRAFFYWFAFNCDKDGDLAYVPKGKKDAPLVPEQRQVSLLTGSEDEFNRDHRVFDNVTLVADGFTTRRDNLTILSRERLDKQYKALNAYTGPQMAEFHKESLLQDKHTARRAKAMASNARDYYLASTYALMLRSLEVDSEIASITHEAPRQLLAAIGLTHRNIVTPEWLQFGMGSFFETGKGAPWGGAGGPNWIYLLDYKERAQHRLSGRMDKPLDNLKAVVTDSQFRATGNGQDEAALRKARTMAWSLTYFLAHRKLGNDQFGLIRYYRELARMPRDLEFDANSLLHLFARAFNCLDAKGEKPDDGKLQQLAEEWNRFIDLTPLEVEEFVKELRNTKTELKATQKPGEKKPTNEKPVEGESN